VPSIDRRLIRNHVGDCRSVEHETETNDVNLLQVSVTPQRSPKSWPWPWPWECSVTDMVELRCETGVFFLWEDADIQQLWGSRCSFVLRPFFEPFLLLGAPRLEFKLVGEIYTCPRTYNIRLWWLIFAPSKCRRSAALAIPRILTLEFVIKQLIFLGVVLLYHFLSCSTAFRLIGIVLIWTLLLVAINHCSNY